MDYRHELKFQVSDVELEIIRYRLKPLMQVDIHQEEDSYTVRSLYFDDLYNSCMRENEDGVDNRRKYRIRIYNGNDTVIKLEKKIKIRGMTRKVSEEISKTDCLTYMAGRTIELEADASDLEKELYAEMKMSGMHPVSIVEYERTAFVEPKGNVRITFDRNIGVTEKVEEFLDQNISQIPVLPAGVHVLEVKYDELLPEYISQVLETGRLQRSSFSKYWHSRNYKNFN